MDTWSPNGKPLHRQLFGIHKKDKRMITDNVETSQLDWNWNEYFPTLTGSTWINFLFQLGWLDCETGFGFVYVCVCMWIGSELVLFWFWIFDGCPSVHMELTSMDVCSWQQMRSLNKIRGKRANDTPASRGLYTRLAAVIILFIKLSCEIYQISCQATLSVFCESRFRCSVAVSANICRRN